MADVPVEGIPRSDIGHFLSPAHGNGPPMRDVQLWRALRTGSFEPTEIVPELELLSEQPIADRLPFLGYLDSALTHPDAAVRLVAVKALKGAYGFLTIRALVEAMNDFQPEVRAEAVRSLYVAAHDRDNPVWVHALFHPDPTIRRQALTIDGGLPCPKSWALHLLADPANRDAALQVLETVTLDHTSVSLLGSLCERGLLTAERAMAWIEPMDWPSLYSYLTQWGARFLKDSNAILAALKEPDWSQRIIDHPSHDKFDELFTLVLRADPASSAAWFRKLFDAIRSYQEPYRERIAAALLRGVARNHLWEAPLAVRPSFDALTMFMAIFPRMLANSCVPVEVRRQAVLGIYDLKDATPRCDDALLRELLQSPLCWFTPQQLDLWIVGGILHLAEGEPYRKLIELTGIAPILRAFEADPERAVPFFRLFDNSKLGRHYLIRELCLQPRAARSRLLAMLARVVPTDGLEFLDTLDGGTACDFFVQHELLNHPHIEALKEKKAGRIADYLAPRILAGHLGRFLQDWLTHAHFDTSLLGVTLLGRIGRMVEPHILLNAVRSLDPVLRPRLLQAVNICPGFPYTREAELAMALVGHPEPAVRAWAELRLRSVVPRKKPAPLADYVTLHLRTGLCDTLAARAEAEPSVDTCLSLLASHDPPALIATQFARYSTDSEEFIKRLDEGMIEHWRKEERLPMLGHAWLYLWDDHRRWFGERIADGASVDLLLRASLPWNSPVLRDRLWLAVSKLLHDWQRTRPDHLAGLWPVGFVQLLLETLPTNLGPIAAKLLLLWKQVERNHDRVDGVRDELLIALTQSNAPTRELLKLWVDVTGVPVPDTLPTVEAAGETTVEAPQELDVNESTDIDSLIQCIRENRSRIPAIRRLQVLRSAGLEALVHLLDDELCGNLIYRAVRLQVAQWPDDAPWDRLADRVLAWPTFGYEGIGFLDRLHTMLPARQEEIVAYALRQYDANPEIAVKWRLRNLLAEWGIERELEPTLAQAAEQLHNLSLDDTMRQQMLEYLETVPNSAFRMLQAEDTRIAQIGLNRIKDMSAESLDLKRAMEAFLEIGTTRPREHRVAVAEYLHQHYRSPSAIPVLMRTQEVDEDHPEPYPELLARQTRDVIRATALGTLMTGRSDEDQSRVLKWLESKQVDMFSKQEAFAELIQFSPHEDIRTDARKRMRPSAMRMLKLRRISETFAWGIRIGRELTGRLYGIEMIPGGDNLGYTRFSENKLYITPIPLLRGDLHGREVVRALILHEYGHHLYHRGTVEEAIWKEAQDQGLHPLLNLVSDEHLERNLRALDRSFGDQLKLLAAYAFQHTHRDLPIEQLFQSLQGHAFEVLTSTRLEAARKYNAVAVSSGRLLHQMERAGLSFARFFRALRMGLGNRHEDPRVEQGLELFRGKFRKSDMRQLKTIAEKLREIFGAECDILNSFGQDALLSCDSDELGELADGISNDDIQREVQRNLEGKRTRNPDRDIRGGKGLNLGAEETFDEIHKIEPVRYDPAAHRGYVDQVARAATRMRRFFDGLGLSMQPQRLRTTGKMFDKSRVRAVVLRGDPRMLIARRIQQYTDLFLGVVVDCSGSMSHNDNIEKAKLFGTLLAEAGKGQPGLDVRLFGFTDSVIFDAGRANRCAIHGLYAGGGNNDSAGLWHAAQAATASKRKAKLLVMISDGSPTECSVSSLRALVQRLTHRHHICCAQVAVCELDHICFDNYILLDVNNVEESVRKFGQTMVRLVLKAMRGG